MSQPNASTRSHRQQVLSQPHLKGLQAKTPTPQTHRVKSRGTPQKLGSRNPNPSTTPREGVLACRYFKPPPGKLLQSDIVFVLDLDGTLYSETKHNHPSPDTFYNSFSKDPELSRLMSDCMIDKMLFTSANYEHALGTPSEPGILRRMKLKTHFKKVLTCDTYQMDKRDPKMYPLAHQFFGLQGKKYILFFDDQEYNLSEAKKIGWHTVLISEQFNKSSPVPACVDYAFSDIHSSLQFFNRWLKRVVHHTGPAITPPRVERVGSRGSSSEATPSIFNGQRCRLVHHPHHHDQQQQQQHPQALALAAQQPSSQKFQRTEKATTPVTTPRRFKTRFTPTKK